MRNVWNGGVIVAASRSVYAARGSGVQPHDTVPQSVHRAAGTHKPAKA